LAASETKVINDLNANFEKIKVMTVQVINTIFSQIIAKVTANTPKSINISLIDDGTKQIINDIIQNKSGTFDAYKNQMENNKNIKQLVDKSKSIVAALSLISTKVECQVNLASLEESFSNLEKIASQLKLPPIAMLLSRDNTQPNEISSQQKTSENKTSKKVKSKAGGNQMIQSTPSANSMMASSLKEPPITLKIQVPQDVLQLPHILDASALASNFSSFKRPFPDINETTPVKKKTFVTVIKEEQSVKTKDMIDLLLIDYKNNVKGAFKNRNLGAAHINYIVMQLIAMPQNLCKERLSTCNEQFYLEI
jgi:hypothetical protein